MYGASVIVLLVLLLSSARAFSWDIVVAGNRMLEFYHKGSLAHRQIIHSAHKIASVTYDPVHNRVLFADHNYPKMSISSFDLYTREIHRLVTRKMDYTTRVVYDPVTQELYWSDGSSIFSFSLIPASSNTVERDLLVTLDHFCWDLAVDSCGGYIYWITDKEIGRIRLDGSQREVLISSPTDTLGLSLAIDQQTQRLYWSQKTQSGQVSIESANFNGDDRTTLYTVGNSLVFSLAVTKDSIYWQNYDEEGIWKLPKNQTRDRAIKLNSTIRSDCASCQRIAANYLIKEQIQGIKSCNVLQGLIPKNESTSVCQNYCFQGECNISDEGDPSCSCKAGYSGERCELNACLDYCLHGGVCSLDEHHQRVCQCAAGYEGERCDVAICNEYCLRGDCSVGADGRPLCSCTIGYSGERCEVNVCHEYCLHGGVCSVDEEGHPVCQCAAEYNGGRCEVPAVTSNRASESGCECSATYEGDRYDVPSVVIKWVIHAYQDVPPVALSDAGNSSCAVAVV